MFGLGQNFRKQFSKLYVCLVAFLVTFLVTLKGQPPNPIPSGWSKFWQVNSCVTTSYTCREAFFHFSLLLRPLDTVFQGQYLPRLSINYVTINKDLAKLPPQLYQTKMKICYDQSCNDIGVVIATKWRHYLFYLQQYFSALGTVLRKIVHGSFLFQ